MNEQEFEKQTYAHIDEVHNRIFKFVKKLMDLSAHHDESKLESPEREIFAEYTPKLKGCTYGSDEYAAHMKEMQVALDHHYAVNSHHPEHFENGIDGMTLLDLVEMMCDWKSATLRHDDGDIMKSIEHNRGRFHIGQQLTTILRNTIKQLGWESRDG